jgi:hypothetical protein
LSENSGEQIVCKISDRYLGHWNSIFYVRAKQVIPTKIIAIYDIAEKGGA